MKDVLQFVEDSDLDVRSYNGGGPGGQHSNKTLSGVEITHRPTGIMAKSDNKRSWWQNKQAALSELEKRVAAAVQSEAQDKLNAERVEQIGIGDRPSHDWTWTAWRDSVTDHNTGKTYVMSKALKGRF